MDRDRLKQYLDAGLSLTDIGALENRDPSTVGYWVEKFGLEANGRRKCAPRGGLAREQLEPLVESGATVKEIAEVLDRSQSTIRHWLRKYRLKTTSRRGRRTRGDLVDHDEVGRAIRAGRRSVPGVCGHHGETSFAIVGLCQRVQCKRCRSEAVSRRRRKVKEITTLEAGGACIPSAVMTAACRRFSFIIATRSRRRLGSLRAG